MILKQQLFLLQTTTVLSPTEAQYAADLYCVTKFARGTYSGDYGGIQVIIINVITQ